MHQFLQQTHQHRSDLFAGIRLLAGLAVSFATVAGAAAGPGKAPLPAVCAILVTGLLFGAGVFVLTLRLSATPLTQPTPNEAEQAATVAAATTTPELPAPPPRKRPRAGTRSAAGPSTSVAGD